MQITEDTLNRGFVPVRPVIFERKGLIILINDTNTRQSIGEILIGSDKGKYILYPKFSGFDIDGLFNKVRLIPQHDILCFVTPDSDETVVDAYESKQICNPEAEWLNQANTVRL